MRNPYTSIYQIHIWGKMHCWSAPPSVQPWITRRRTIVSCSVSRRRFTTLFCIALSEEKPSSGLKRRETFQRVIKSQHLWWYGVHKCIWSGQFACFGRHYEYWKVYKGFRATYAPLQTTSISGKALCMSISAGQCKKKEKKTGNLYQARMGPNSNINTPETHNLDGQMSSNCFEKNRRCYTMVNMPRPNYFETWQ